LLQASAASNMTRCYLELDGKSANVVFAGAKNLKKAAAVSAVGIFRNSGQICVAGSRLLVERSIYDDFVAELASVAAAMKVGDPLDVTMQSGAVNNAKRLQQNLQFVETAQSEGGTLYQGGSQILQDTGSCYMEPTIITNVGKEHTVAQKEVFRPVVAVTAFDDEKEDVALANSTELGLAGGVWTNEIGRAHRFTRAM
jgi:gamma-glutamyl-gamma-aminobutyraldehyde dehydrogenase